MSQAFSLHQYTRPGHTILSEPVIQEICHSMSTFFEAEVPFESAIPNCTIEQIPLPTDIPFKILRIFPPNLAKRSWISKHQEGVPSSECRL